VLRIVAFNESGDSPPSNIACVTPVAAPTNLTATPVDDSTIAVTWTDNSRSRGRVPRSCEPSTASGGARCWRP